MMEKIRNDKGTLVNVICAVLMAVLLVLQFTPFWHYGNAGESCSIGGYVWFPSDHKELENWLGIHAEGHDLNSFVGMPILVLVLSAIGAAVFLIKPVTGWTAVFPTACGAAGMMAYLTSAALKLGSGWTWHLLICIALLALGAFSLTQLIKEMKK